LTRAGLKGIFFVDTERRMAMKTRIQKWGNSLAVRIPKALAEGAHLEQDSLVELTLENGRLTLHPIPPPAFTLEELLAQVTEENLHGEVDMGPAVGKEVW
jgi:antitoxin MazE